MTRGAVVRVVRGWWVCSERALGVRCNGSEVKPAVCVLKIPRQRQEFDG